MPQTACYYYRLYVSAITVPSNYIEDVLILISERRKSIFILGDFNDNLLLNDDKLSRLIKNNRLTQIIDKPTRITLISATL